MLEAASTIESKIQLDLATTSSSDCSEIPSAGKSSQVSSEYLQACAGGVPSVVQPPTVDSPNDNDKVENANDPLIEPLVVLFREFLGECVLAREVRIPSFRQFVRGYVQRSIRSS